jgi:hypothetical protein
VDELLVGLMKQILLRQVAGWIILRSRAVQEEAGPEAGRAGVESRCGPGSGPLLTLRQARWGPGEQPASASRNALLKICLHSKGRLVAKSCENLHVL